jgi:hypothetical protein
MYQKILQKYRPLKDQQQETQTPQYHQLICHQNQQVVIHPHQNLNQTSHAHRIGFHLDNQAKVQHQHPNNRQDNRAHSVQLLDQVLLLLQQRLDHLRQL